MSSQDVKNAVRGNIKHIKTAAVTQYIWLIYADALYHIFINKVLKPDGCTILLNSYNRDWNIPIGNQIQDYLSCFHWNQMILSISRVSCFCVNQIPMLKNIEKCDDC